MGRYKIIVLLVLAITLILSLGCNKKAETELQEIDIPIDSLSTFEEQAIEIDKFEDDLDNLEAPKLSIVIDVRFFISEIRRFTFSSCFCHLT